jgi:uncharacterized membrane protein YvlD (DUF360 family)
VRWLIRIGLSLGANAVALAIAAIVLKQFEITGAGFVVSVVIFSIASLILRPLVVWGVMKLVRPLLGVVGLISTWVILLVTDIVSDGIQIEGIGTWIAATVIVWLGSVAYELLGGRLLRKVTPGPARPR